MTLASLALLLTLAARAAAPLHVVVVVDQMRADYLENSTSTAAYSGGLKRLAREGFVFTEAGHTHATLETGPGHAVILSGRLPDSTGIIGHAWYDVEAGKEVYCVDDSVHGVGLENFRGYTLADALKAKHPQSKVVSLSIKDRAAVFMGGRRADAVLWYSKAKGSFVTSSYYPSQPWLERFNESLKAKGGALAGATTAYYGEIVYTPQADAMLLELAFEAARRHKLGRDDIPDILAVSFSATDYVGHRYGPDSASMQAQLQRLDQTLGALLTGLEKLVGPGRVDVALTADHGAFPLPDVGKPTTAQTMLWDDFTAILEKAMQYDFPAKDRWIVSNWFPNVYLNRALARRLGLDWLALRRQAAQHFRKLPGMAEALIPEEIAPGTPFYELVKRNVVAGRTGDVFLIQKPGMMLLDEGDRLNHGAPYEFDAHVPLVFWGPSYAAGRSSQTARVADLAVTVGAALGLDYKPDAESRVLLAPRD